MSRGMKAALAAVLIAAAALMGFLGAGILRERAEIREMSRELEESRDAWEETAARKEELQAQLKSAREELREAQLTIEESETRAEELRADIAQLEEEIAGLGR